MNRMKKVGIALGLVAMLFVAGTAQAAVQKFSSSFTFLLPDLCNGGAAVIDGTVSAMLVGNGPNGGQLKIWVKGKGDGFLFNPLSYNFIAQAQVKFNGPPGGGKFTVDIRAKLIAKGGADNGYLRIRFEVHVNANGDITAFTPLTIEAECRG